MCQVSLQQHSSFFLPFHTVLFARKSLMCIPQLQVGSDAPLSRERSVDMHGRFLSRRRNWFEGHWMEHAQRTIESLLERDSAHYQEKCLPLKTGWL